MSIKTRRIILPLLVIGIIGFSGVTNSAYAASTTSNSNGNFFSGLITAIAQKFGLDQNQVKATVDDYRNQKKQQRQENMQQREDNRLDQLVKDGKITDAQKTAILNELAALKTKYNLDSLKNETPDQRKQAMTNMKNDLESWAKSQGIDPKYIFPGPGMIGGFGRRWMRTSPSVTPTP